MLIETLTDKPVRLVGPRLNGAIVLQPGEPMEIDAAIGKRVLRQYAPKIRVARSQWITGWNKLATSTQHISEGDPRFQSILQVLNTCDQAFEQENWAAFQRLAEKIQTLCQK